MLTPKRLEILLALWMYPVLWASQIRDLVLPGDKQAANIRAHLRALCAMELVRKYQPRIVDPFGNGTVAPVYTLTIKGSSVIATKLQDTKYLRRNEISMSDWMSVSHWGKVSGLTMVIRSAFKGTEFLKDFSFEQDVIDPEQKDPALRFRLYERISEKLVFAPDMAFETEVREVRRVFYGEYETGSDSPARVAAKKWKGVTELGDKFKKAFPHANDFRVIAYCPYAGYRDTLRKEMKDKDKKGLWLFVATPDVTQETREGDLEKPSEKNEPKQPFFHRPIFYTVEKGPFPLIPNDGGSPGEVRGEVVPTVS